MRIAHAPTYNVGTQSPPSCDYRRTRRSGRVILSTIGSKVFNDKKKKRFIHVFCINALNTILIIPINENINNEILKKKNLERKILKKKGDLIFLKLR